MPWRTSTALTDLDYEEIGRAFFVLLQGELEFAAAKKGSKGKGGANKKDCKKGLSCGGTCISKKKTCIKEMSAGQKAKYNILAKKIKTAGGGDSNESPMSVGSVLADRGAEVLGDKLAKLDDFVNRADLKKLDEAFNEAFDADPVGAYQSQAWKDLLEAQNNRGLAIDLMTEIRSSLAKISREEAEAIASKTKILKAASKDEAEIRSVMADFYQLTGGAGSDSLKKIKRDSSRAYANAEDGTLNIGKYDSPGEMQKTLFHEMAHHAEFESPALRDLLNDWIDARSQGAEPQKLNDIIGVKFYSEYEYARPDKFIDPYVGKIYSADDTEALSMGMEFFTSPRDMLHLYEKDREHFLVIVGALNQ